MTDAPLPSGQADGPEIITMGCRLNIAESEVIAASLGGQSDVIVVNSCAVTNEAVRQTRQAIRRAHRRRPDARIVVTGCAAQVDPAMFAQMAEVSAVRGTAPHLATSFSGHARAFVEVQNGCDHRCTFCIIPFGRGNSRSVPAGQVVDAIRKLVDQGYGEVVLTGVDVTSYGHDLPGQPTLGALIERILTLVPELPRLRLSSLDGVEIDDRLFALLTQEERVMPHVHLSLQAGDNMILKRMKRRHSREQAIAMVRRLKDARPDIAIGADIIAGFPTEDEAMFENSLKLVGECAIVHGHIFPYSPKAGTPAERMPQVAPDVRKERAARLRAAVADERGRWLDGLVGTTQKVLVERSRVKGHAANFAEVRFDRPLSEGSMVDAHIVAVKDGILEGRVTASGQQDMSRTG